MAGIFSLKKRRNEIIGILVIAWAIFSLLALVDGAAGVVGEVAADFYTFFLGEAALTLPILFVLLGLKFITGPDINKLKIAGFFLAYFSSLTIFHLSQGFQDSFASGLLGAGGGVIGGTTAHIFETVFGSLGSRIILLSLTLVGLLLLFDVFLTDFVSYLFSAASGLFSDFKSILTKISPSVLLAQLKKRMSFQDNGESSSDSEEYDESAIAKNPVLSSGENDDSEKEEPKILEEDSNDKPEAKADPKDDFFEENPGDIGLSDGEKAEDEDNLTGENWQELIEVDQEEEGYQIPPLKLLDEDDIDSEGGEDKSDLLEKTLDNFGVDADVVETRKGPTLTRYEVQPETGVKVNKIVNLSDDIALSLAAKDVRIEAPIPGKSALGIEVPNQGASLVRLKGVLESSDFKESDEDELLIGLGRAIEGSPVVADLTEMPHLLIAGATGSGKSVCINSVITSLLFQHSPEDLKLLLIDPKKVELVNFKELPHLFSPVVTDCKKAASTLKLVVEEMEKRYEKFAESGTRGIESYNEQAEEELPYIVVVIDELSDLMMVAANEVESSICRLAQMSRAAGIHLVIATQRPSVDVITGLIKANIPSRIAFAVSSNTDSRTILDESGAEKLLGDGDMLYYPVGAKKPYRVQGSFISNEEVNRVTSFINQQTDPEFFIDEDEFDDLSLEELEDEEDELLEDAIELVVEYRASISMLQRRLHIGHSRAARLIDKMEEMGVVGPYNGPKPREVLISEDELDKFLSDEQE